MLLDENGKIWITDFGLARIESDAAMTMTGDLLGTLRYMSPEQAFGKRAQVDYRVDIYSLGATLYELLTLQPAIRGEERGQMLKQLADYQPTALRKIDPSLPVELETIVTKAMEGDPAERYTTAAEFADDLRRFLTNKPISARRSTVAERSVKWVRRYPALAGLIAVVLLSISALSVGALWHANRLARELTVVEELHDFSEMQHANMQRFRYLLDMQLAARSMGEDKYTDAQDRLSFYLPPSEFADDRDFAWYYLWQKCSEASKIFAGHSGMVRSFTVAPNSNLLISGGDDQTVRFFDLETTEPLAVLDDFAGKVYAVEITPDERTLFTAGEGGELLVWNIAAIAGGGEPAESHLLEDHTEDVLCLAISDDGKHLASAGARGDVLVWELPSMKLASRLEGHTDWVRDLEFSPDGKTLASISHDDYLILWDVERSVEKRRTRVVDGHPLGLCVTFHPSGKFLATGSSLGEASILRLNDLEKVSQFDLPASWIRSLDFSADGEFLVLSGNNPSVCILRFDEQMQLTLLRTLRTRQSETWRVLFVDNQNAIASCGIKGNILLRRINSEQHTINKKLSVVNQLKDPTHELLSHRLVASSDRKKALLVTRHSAQVFELDFHKFFPQLKISTANKTTNKSYSGAISPDGQWVGLANWSAIRIAQTSNMEWFWKVPGKKDNPSLQSFFALAFHPFGDVLAVGTNAGELQILKSPSGELIATTQPFGETRVTDVLFAAEGRLVSACFSEIHSSKPAAAIVWDAGSLEELHRIEGVERILAVSPDGNRLALVNRDRSIQLWNLATQSTEMTFEGHPDIIISGDFSPDGKYFLSTSRTGPIKLWSTETGQLTLDIVEDLILPQVVFTSNNSAVATSIKLLENDEEGEFTHELVPLVTENLQIDWDAN